MNDRSSAPRALAGGGRRAGLASVAPRACLGAALWLGGVQGQAQAGSVVRPQAAEGAAAPMTPGADTPTLAAVVAASSTEAFHATASAAFTAYERGLTTRCGLVVPDWEQASMTTYGGEPVLDADGGLYKALWVVTVPGRACDSRRLYRVRVDVVAGVTTVRGMLPGTGVSSPDLDADSIPSVSLGVRRHLHRRCPLDVLNTRLMGASSVGEAQPWQEIWTVRSCGVTLSVPVRFTPDDQDDGTAIDLDPDEIAPAR